MRYLLAALLALCAGSAFACEPCPKNYSLEESLAQADLVLVASIDAPVTVNDQLPHDNLIADVKLVLKGAWHGGHIQLRSTYGMCNYGFAPTDGDALLLIEYNGKEYTTVLGGCGVKALALKNNNVIIDGKSHKSMPIDNFVKQYLH